MGVEMLEHVLHSNEGLSRTRWGREMNVVEALHLFQLHLDRTSQNASKT